MQGEKKINRIFEQIFCQANSEKYGLSSQSSHKYPGPLKLFLSFQAFAKEKARLTETQDSGNLGANRERGMYNANICACIFLHIE